MIEAAANAAAVRGTDDHGDGPFAIGAVAHFGGFADDLIVGRENKIGELNLADGALAIQSSANAHTHNGKLCQRRVNHPGSAIFIKEANSGAEHAAAHADIFTHDKDTLIASHFFVHGLPDGFNQGNLSHDAPPRHKRGSCRLQPPGKGLWWRNPRHHLQWLWLWLPFRPPWRGSECPLLPGEHG